jgi:hypothetical protein
MLYRTQITIGADSKKGDRKGSRGRARMPSMKREIDMRNEWCYMGGGPLVVCARVLGFRRPKRPWPASSGTAPSMLCLSSSWMILPAPPPRHSNWNSCSAFKHPRRPSRSPVRMQLRTKCQCETQAHSKTKRRTSR